MATFTNEQVYGQAVSIIYDAVGITYDTLAYTYNGQLITIWTNEVQN